MAAILMAFTKTNSIAAKITKFIFDRIENILGQEKKSGFFTVVHQWVFEISFQRS